MRPAFSQTQVFSDDFSHSGLVRGGVKPELHMVGTIPLSGIVLRSKFEHHCGRGHRRGFHGRIHPASVDAYEHPPFGQSRWQRGELSSVTFQNSDVFLMAFHAAFFTFARGQAQKQKNKKQRSSNPYQCVVHTVVKSKRKTVGWRFCLRATGRLCTALHSLCCEMRNCIAQRE